MKTTPEKLDSRRCSAASHRSTCSRATNRCTAGRGADAIRAAARAQGFTEREVFFIERANSGPWDEIFAAAQALSLFASRRLLEIRIPGGKPGTEARRRCRNWSRLAGRDLLLLVITGELDWTTQKAAWVQALDGAGVWVDGRRPCRWRGFRPGCARAPQRAGMQLDDAARGRARAADRGQPAGGRAGTAEAVRWRASRSAGAAEVLASVTQSSRFDVTQLGEAVLRGDPAARAARAGRPAGRGRRAHADAVVPVAGAAHGVADAGAGRAGAAASGRATGNCCRPRPRASSRWAVPSSRGSMRAWRAADRIVKGRQRRQCLG